MPPRVDRGLTALVLVGICCAVRSRAPTGVRPFASLSRSFIRGDHFTQATVSQNFKTYEGKPLAIPAEAAGPKAEYLEWHRNEVFGK